MKVLQSITPGASKALEPSSNGTLPQRMRRILNQMHDVDATEISGVWRVPCRHCWGLNNQFQYTRAEMQYLMRAHDYGESGWPQNCITAEYGMELFSHAVAAYIAGRRHLVMDLKGGDGFTRQGDPNPYCPQCTGIGVEMFWICDTRKLSRAARRVFVGAELTNSGGVKVHTENRQPIRDILCRDLKIGTERKELAMVPADPASLTDDQLRDAISRMETYSLPSSEYSEVSVEPTTQFRRRSPVQSG